MEKISLNFISPRTLGELKVSQSIEPSLWHYHNSNEPLELDPLNWVLYAGEKSCIINQWEVNQTSHTMRITSESQNLIEGFEPLDYTFAVAMIGQIGNRSLLLDYLESLKQLYLIESDNSNEDQPEKLKNNE